ncbi:MAG: Rne/Rng family ribonuclease [Candidatus Cloacimonetes bacterium]|nr:Rne/Rng family ribonuclease [Candidatus Cloacimonadota bacterium]MBS3767161.1 Rne/Rng family ribonuclease [Candidatus Cloacimonadota bacterium]
MKTELIVNIAPFENTLALLENGILVELYTHSSSTKEVVGNIYKGVVKDNVPGMGACFVNIGLDRTALFHYRDAIPDTIRNKKLKSKKFRKQVRHNNKKMGTVLESGQEVLVQVEKPPVGKKGARLTGEISIPGKYMVLIPYNDYVAISRRITNNKEKKRLKKIVLDAKYKNMGVIVRTNAEGHSEKDLKREYKNLSKIWRDIRNQYKKAPPETCLFDDNDLPSIIIRDLIHKNIDKVIIDSKSYKEKLIKRLKRTSPDKINKIKLYNEESDILDSFGIEKEIQKIFKNRLYLNSGGFIVIQETEALVSIDVNTGSFVGGKNLEKTVTTTNIDAAKEIARQIRLQDLTGMLFIDFIDMKRNQNRNKVIQTFKEEMKKDFSPHKIFSKSPLNLVEMTRKRSKTDVLSSYFETCPCCHSVGRVLSRNTTLNKIFKWLDRAEKYHPVDSLEITVHPWVYKFAQQNEDKLKRDYHFTWNLKSDIDLDFKEFQVYSIKSKKDITDLYKT